MSKLLLSLLVTLSLVCAVKVSAQSGVVGQGIGVPNGAGCNCDAMTFGPGTLTTGSTIFISPSTSGANQNFASISPRNGTFRNFYWRVTTAPGAGNSVTYTLYIGAITSMSATSVTCAITDANTTCNDTTHAASITAGQAWAIQAVSSASATATAQQMGGIEQDF